MTARILLIEDDLSLATSLQKVLRSENYEVEVAARGNEGLARARLEPFDLVITDLKLPGLNGLELTAQLHEAKPRLPIIMMTAHGTTETAIEATKLGACEYLLKPCEADELLALVSSAVANSRMMSEPVEIGDQGNGRLAIVGSSKIMQNLYKEIGRVAATPFTVLIQGETGVGKELVARALYQHSDRAAKPFIAVNCAAIPENLLESELFGHERGAFTGAESRRVGRFEQAHGGTIFLDEIGDLSASTQAKLLRVLQEKTIRRVGGDAVIAVDARVIAATHRDLKRAIQENEFREDLFYRLSVVTINVPPLSQRRDDIPDLVRFFMRRYARDLEMDLPAIHPQALVLLQNQPWPGNIRELENVVRQALLLAKPFAISQEHVEQVLTKARAPVLAGELSHSAYVADLLARAQRGEVTDVYAVMFSELEKELFTQAIKLAGGNQAKAARWLGITRLKLRERLIQLRIHPSQEIEQKGD